MKLIRAIIGIVFLIPSPAYPVGMEVFPDGVMDLGSVVFEMPSRSRTDSLQIIVKVGCHQQNLRGVANPLAAGGNIRFNMTLWQRTGLTASWGALPVISLQIPARYVRPEYWTTVSNPSSIAPIVTYGGLPATGWNSYSDFQNRQFIVQTNILYSTTTVTSSGEFDTTAVNFAMRNLDIVQVGVGTPGVAYLGANGPLTREPQVGGFHFSPDSGTLTLRYSFPGAAVPGQRALWANESIPGGAQVSYGFCGNWYSPLMLFFDEKRPEFTASTSFPLVDGVPGTYWTEPDAPGYFLALDRDHSGRIENGSELFGDGISTNGFEALAQYDSNHDGVIDSADPIFKDLLLWKDKNSDGFSQKKEIFPISHFGISRISLKYTVADLTDVAQRARLRESSDFEFKDGSKTKKGKVIDVWFSPAAPPRQWAEVLPSSQGLMPLLR